MNTDVVRIKVWMIEHDVTQSQIADDLDFDHSTINHVIHGRRKSRTVVEAFIKRGCPAEYFGDYKTDRRRKRGKKTKGTSHEG